jgi:hypothetical protein
MMMVLVLLMGRRWVLDAGGWLLQVVPLLHPADNVITLI